MNSIKVSSPPRRPLMIYDGECNFCRQWIARWQSITEDKLDYASSQEVANHYPEIPQTSFDSAVQLVDVDGCVYSGARAVLKALSISSWYAWSFKAYERFSFVAQILECLYAFVAKRRSVFSLVTRLLWGRSVEPATYVFSSWLFLRLLGVIVLFAVVSYWSQADGLIGSGGILPAEQSFELIKKRFAELYPGQNIVTHIPNIFLLSATDTAIHGVFLTTALMGVLLMFGICPLITLLLIWFLYASLMFAGQQFLSFQWDILLLQTVFLSLFYAPWKIRDKLKSHPEPLFAGRMVLWLTLICLMFQSGIVKLQSFDVGNVNTWRDLTALNYHYWTQPLPIASSWYFHHMPSWFGKLSLLSMLFIELVLPFCLLAPRRIKNIAIVAQILLQLMIIISGNYGYFNLLTIVLCVPFIDDQSLPKRLRDYLSGLSPKYPTQIIQRIFAIPMCCIVACLLLFLSWSSCYRNTEENKANAWLEKNPMFAETLNFFNSKLHAVSSYGLFRVMTLTRPEIVISGSDDQIDWIPYRFKYKPVDLDKAPRWVVPHMPRLDWQMWFEALNYERSGNVSSWFVSFLRGVITKKPAIIALLANNPFPESEPKFIKLELYEYEFTSKAERKETANVWKRKPITSRTVIIPVSKLQ